MNEEIIRLTNLWYRYVGMDHHKDRDCHFYIECAYSYGDSPKYYAYHNGYRMDDWKTPIRKTFAEAEKDLENKLHNEINSHILEIQMRLSSNEEDFLISHEELEQELKALRGEL